MREDGGTCPFGGGKGPMARAEGLPIEGLVGQLRNSGGIAEEDDRASSCQPSAKAENIDLLKLETTDSLTCYSSYFKESLTESDWRNLGT